MAALLLPFHGPEPDAAPRQTFDWDRLVRRRILEISGEAGSARLSCAVDLLLQAQRRGETVVWIQPVGGCLYPPDLQQSGVDLASLVVVHVPRQAGAFGLPKAAEILLRSGAYGLVVLDFLQQAALFGTAWQGRLLSLARAHDSAVVVLTHKATAADSLGPLISLRLEPRRQRVAGDNRFEVATRVVKNKGGLAWPSQPLQRQGPLGL